MDDEISAFMAANSGLIKAWADAVANLQKTKDAFGVESEQHRGAKRAEHVQFTLYAAYTAELNKLIRDKTE